MIYGMAERGASDCLTLAATVLSLPFSLSGDYGCSRQTEMRKELQLLLQTAPNVTSICNEQEREEAVDR